MKRLRVTWNTRAGATGSWRLGGAVAKKRGVCGEQRAAQRGPHSRPCSQRPSLHALDPLWTRSGPAPASTDLHLCWLTSGHCLMGSLRPALHCPSALCRPLRRQGPRKGSFPGTLCGLPRGRDWESCLSTAEGSHCLAEAGPSLGGSGHVCPQLDLDPKRREHAFAGSSPGSWWLGLSGASSCSLWI